ncbi:hypothetical protein CTI12_AA024620 [Artemisia annua]|uniref:Retrotransposon gag domain-containing protein n=1 Tax=Artemisia annua TaxID=35608 RepID=A0A2U1QIS5_ARTAN|nr:hypothetical protein CTI12_AA024620 [Artemisia annua]
MQSYEHRSSQFFTELVINPFNSVTTVISQCKDGFGCELKLGFIDGTCVKPPMNDVNVQRWVRCDYMVTRWFLNSMVTELSDAFLYAQSACELWKEIGERYGQSNGPLLYQLERELRKITRGNLSIAAFFNKLKRC